MAQICCDCERYIGTQGGGMDQAISFLAEKGYVSIIYKFARKFCTHLLYYCVLLGNIIIPQTEIFLSIYFNK